MDLGKGEGNEGGRGVSASTHQEAWFGGVEDVGETKQPKQHTITNTRSTRNTSADTTHSNHRATWCIIREGCAALGALDALLVVLFAVDLQAEL